MLIDSEADRISDAASGMRRFAYTGSTYTVTIRLEHHDCVIAMYERILLDVHIDRPLRKIRSTSIS